MNKSKNAKILKFLKSKMYFIITIIFFITMFISVLLCSFFTYDHEYDKFRKIYYESYSIIYSWFSGFPISFYSSSLISLILLIIYWIKKNKFISFSSITLYFLGSISLFIGGIILVTSFPFDNNYIFLFITIINLSLSLLFEIFEMIRIYMDKGINVKKKQREAYGKLLQLKELYDNGVITEEEFNATKRKYVNFL